jgi:hypothetical protein
VGTEFDKVLNGLAGFLGDTREYIVAVYTDLFPSSTTLLTRWLDQFGIFNPPPTDADKRDILSAYWVSGGDQSPRSIQDTLQAAGFDVYVYDWWSLPRSDPPTPIDPNVVLVSPAYLLVNNNSRGFVDYGTTVGTATSTVGTATSTVGQLKGLDFALEVYPIPSDPVRWRSFMYIASDVAGVAQVPAARRAEFETLLLKITPANLWLGVLVEYV